MASANDTICPPPFISDADYQGGGGYVEGRFCGINPSAPLGQKCCLPCPVQDWVYPADYVRTLKVANYAGISSVALCGLLLLSFLILPPKRSGRHYLTIGVTLAIAFLSVAFVIPLGTEPAMCRDRITPNGQDSDTSCTWTGALLLLGAMGSVLWILLRALWLHLRICWDIKPGRPFMIFSILTGIFIPVAFTVVSMKVTGVSYRTGLVCLPNHHKAITTFWAWELGFAGAALLVQCITTGYCVWVFLRVLVVGKGKRDGGGGGGGSDDGRETVAQERSGPEQSSFASQPSTGSEPAERSQKTWRQIRRILLMQWRHIALTVIMAVESLFYIIIFVAQDTRFGEAAANVDRPEARTWSACLLFNNGDKEACLQYAEELAIPRDLVLGSLLLGSLIGTQNFFLLAKPSIFLGWWELLRHPFKRIPLLGRRDSDLPLTSLDPSERQAPAPGTTKATEAQDYSANGTTPLMVATNTSVPSRSFMFFGHRRPRSRSSRHSSSSSLHGVEVDMPPVTVTNPYKLSLPSERAASLIDPVERARLARTGDIVDLHNLYATDVRDDSAAFNAARPETPPPPPLPLSIAKSPTTSTTKQSMATSAASLSLPSPTQSSSSSFRAAGESSITPIAHARPLPRAHARDDQILPSSSPSPSSSSSSLPPSPATTTGLPTRSATVHHTPSPPPPSHTPDYLRPSRSSGNMATAFMGADGVAANRHHHRLPSWAAHNGSSSTTLGRPSGGAGGGGVGGAGTLVTTAELRDAMRGGLALHPVRANEFGEELGGGAGAGAGAGDGGGGGGAVVAGTGISDDDGDGGRSHAAEEDGGTGVGVGRARGDGAAGETAGMGGHRQAGEVRSGDSDGAFSSSGSDEVVDGRTRRRRKRRGG